MAPKYQPNAYGATYHMGSYYGNWSEDVKNGLDQALNMIAVNSPAGRVLNGDDTGARGKQVFMQNAEFHAGTDINGLHHWNFVIRALGTGGGDQTAQCHLYRDGTYTANGGQIVYAANPAGAVQQPAVKLQTVPKAEEFPPLGGKKT